MNKNDPEYWIVVAMAETLVPDVCKIIMAELELIHIEEGKRRWHEKMVDLNGTYKTCFQWFLDPGEEYLLKHPRHFMFNYRAGYRLYNTEVWNSASLSIVGELPASY
jgi:hypothetical protein